MWPANRASTHVRESRAEGLSCGVQRAATGLSSGACGLVLPEPAVGCQTQLSSGHFSREKRAPWQRALSNSFSNTEAVAERPVSCCRHGLLYMYYWWRPEPELRSGELPEARQRRREGASQVRGEGGEWLLRVRSGWGGPSAGAAENLLKTQGLKQTRHGVGGRGCTTCFR